MDELITIIEQRKQSIRQIQANPRQKHKSQLVEQQRKRNQRENWILRVLKTLKIYTVDQKKLIYDTTVKIMNYHQKIEGTLMSFDNMNYIETIINLFVEFYNMFKGTDLTHIKTIIRPNNSYIIVDLIKTLIDLGRKEYKNVLQEHYKEPFQSQSEKKLSIKSLNKTPPNTASTKHIAGEIEQKQKKEEKHKQKSKQQGNIEFALFEKYNKIIDNFNAEHYYERMNEIYFDLLYMNQKNGLRIQKYLDTCFGPKRHINYDASGLYTQEEIKKMVREKKQKVESRMTELKELKADSSGEQLKEFFKMKIELFDNTNSLPVFDKPIRIRSWLPLVIMKNGDKLHPYHLMIDMNGSYYEITQFQEKFNKKIRIYMKQLLHQMKGANFSNRNTHQTDYQTFNKKDFLDYNQSKVNELLQKEFPIISIKKEPRQNLFPMISPHQSQSNSEDLMTLKSKVKSESKLPSTSLMIPPIKQSQTIEKSFEKRLNYSSFINTIENTSKKRIDHLIDKIVKSKDYSNY